VRSPEMRFLFNLGSDWDSARQLLFTFIKQRIPGQALGPLWEPPLTLGPLLSFGPSLQRPHLSLGPSLPLLPFPAPFFALPPLPSKTPLTSNNKVRVSPIHLETHSVQNSEGVNPTLSDHYTPHPPRQKKLFLENSPRQKKLFLENRELTVIPNENKVSSVGAGVEKREVGGLFLLDSENTRNIDFNNIDSRANLQQGPSAHGATGSAKKALQQGSPARRASESAKKTGTAHLKDNRGESDNSYISPSPSRSRGQTHSKVSPHVILHSAT
jgi:hypothetical protein